MILVSTTFGTNMTFVLGLKTLILASMALDMVSGGCKEEEKGEKEKDQKKKGNKLLYGQMPCLTQTLMQ